MKRLIAFSLILCGLLYTVTGCEKDDICTEDTQTTPSVLIEFYDFSNREEPKTVTDLKYYVEGMEGRTVTGTSMVLELRTDAPTTQWILRYKTPNTTVYNFDVLTFNYTAQEIYVSRACGYKSVFTLNPDTDAAPGVVRTDATFPDNLWIRDFSIENYNIENEDEAHIKIYF